MKRTHCPQGHAYSSDNEIITKNGRYCRACRKEMHRVQRLPDYKPHHRKGKPAKTHCVRGHAFDLLNTAYTKKGSQVCRACQKIRMDEYMTRTGGRAPRDTPRFVSALQESLSVLQGLHQDAPK